MAEEHDSPSAELDAAGVGAGSGSPPIQEEALPALGEVIAEKYRVEELLGRGGMGVVARGRQLELDRPVAIKFLRPTLALDARTLQRFTREARLIAQMRSEHVVRVFDVGRERGLPYIVMEYLTGRDLAREIARGPLAVERAVELVLHACEALGEAHALGIVHRDVKPSNLFLAEGFGGRESLKVLDFGISKWVLPDSEHHARLVTTDGGAVGTPAFASPEQLTRPESIDGCSDIWSLGVVLYQALSGELPFKADTIPALYSQIIGAPPAPFPAGRDVPPELIAVIMRCLERDPKRRYLSMLGLARALVTFAPPRASEIIGTLATLAGSARKDTSFADATAELPPSGLSTTLEFSRNTPHVAAITPSTERPWRRLSLLSALLVLAGVGGALAFMLRPPSPQHEREPSATGAAPPLAEPTGPPLLVPRNGREASPPASPDVPTMPLAPSPAPSAAAKTKRRLNGLTAPHQAKAAGAPAPLASSAPPVASVASPAPSASSQGRSDTVPLYRH